MKPEIKASTIPPAEMVGSAVDLLLEIFLRLPIKSLIRFKSVSKLWQSLISDPGFCILRNPNPNPAIGLIVQDLRALILWNGYRYVPFSGIKSTHPPIGKPMFATHNTTAHTIADVLQSCNGLLLCRRSGPGARDYELTYYVYNPTTNQFSTLPKLDSRCEMCLAFDPAKSPHYKVVSARMLSDSDTGPGRYQLDVYSSESRVWSNCGGPFIGRVSFGYRVFWNGAVHWSVNSMYFNTDDMRLGAMPKPPTSHGRDITYYFGESCDHLHYIVTIRRDVRLNVYEMRRDYSEWFVMYRVELTHVVADNPVVTDYDLLTLVRGEKEEDSFLVLKIEGRVIRYNVVCETFETIYEFADNGVNGVRGSMRFMDIVGFQYIESLCCV